MDSVMVTGRISAEKKAAGNAVLERRGLNASQAVNLLYDRLIEEQDTAFLEHHDATAHEWEEAAHFVDAIASPVPVRTRFDSMTRGEVKLERMKAKGAV